jgi:dTDP-4-dehydrorhamnose reductase
MKILLTGATGQLGQQLVRSAPSQLGGEPLELVPLGRAQLDLADAVACRQMVHQQQPHWVLNAGAYTAVDRAEAEPDLAEAVNAAAPRALAEALAAEGQAGCMLQISTDFVFNGAQGHPYRPSDRLQPLGVYGRSKAMGETAVQEVLGPDRATVLRTSWVYGPVGSNFVATMLRLHRERSNLAVVADQVGCPTSTLGLAQACWRVIDRQLGGVLHWSDAGAASWYDFAVAIGELGVSTGVLERAAEVAPIPSSAYPTPAQRPSYSLLDCQASWERLGCRPPHWRTALEQVLRTPG